MSDEHTFIDPPALRSTDSLPVRTATSNLLDLERVAAHIERAAYPHALPRRTDCQIRQAR
jgi:hypothetical protein